MTEIHDTNLRYRLLLIDDDPDIHELVAVILQSHNVELSLAIDGVQAVDMALRETPDLILLNYGMPGTNGLEILDMLHSKGVSKSIPVVFITGNNNHKILTDCFRAGAADYIRKPFCASEFRARISSVLDRRQMMHQLEQQAMRDSLTGLSNRASIRMRIQSAIDRRHFSN